MDASWLNVLDDLQNRIFGVKSGAIERLISNLVGRVYSKNRCCRRKPLRQNRITIPKVAIIRICQINHQHSRNQSRLHHSKTEWDCIKSKSLLIYEHSSISVLFSKFFEVGPEQPGIRNVLLILIVQYLWSYHFIMLFRYVSAISFNISHWWC